MEFLYEHKDALRLVLRLLVAGVCGGVVGMERAMRQKDAGFRTHVLVALGAALMMIISKHGFTDVVGNGITSDAGRIASNIVTGISFLGAGMIIFRGNSVHGLTTAAGIWVTAALGMAVGCGMYLEGLLATALVVIVQLLFHADHHGTETDGSTHTLSVRMADSPEAVERLSAHLAERGVRVVSSRLIAEAEGCLQLTLSVCLPEGFGLADVAALLAEDPDLRTVAL